MRQRMMSQGVVSLIIGTVGISNLAGKARFDTRVTADVAMLIASGVCIGAALMMFVRAGRRV